MRKIFPVSSDLPPIARVRLRKRRVACPVVNILCSMFLCRRRRRNVRVYMLCCIVDIVLVAVSDWGSDWEEYLG